MKKFNFENPFIFMILITVFFCSIVLFSIFSLLVFLVLSLIFFSLMLYSAEKCFGYPISMKMEMPNVSPEIAIEHISLLIKKTRKQIIIFSGSLHHSIYNSNTLIDEMKDMIKNYAENDINIKIFLESPKADKKSRKFLNLLREHNIPIYSINFKDNDKINHFIISDNRHVRIENKHNPLQIENKALLRMNSPFLAAKIRKHFNRLLEKVDIYEVLPLLEKKIGERFHV